MIKHLYFIFDYSKVAETIKLHKQKFCFNFQDLHSLNLWEATKEIDQRMRRFNSLTGLGVSKKIPGEQYLPNAHKSIEFFTNEKQNTDF